MGLSLPSLHKQKGNRETLSEQSGCLAEAHTTEPPAKSTFPSVELPERLVTTEPSAILKPNVRAAAWGNESGKSQGSAAYSPGTSAMEDSELWWKMP